MEVCGREERGSGVLSDESIHAQLQSVIMATQRKQHKKLVNYSAYALS